MASTRPIARLRERIGRALLREAAELAFDQQALERSFATVPHRAAGYSSAQSAVAMAGWVQSALLRLGLRVYPSAIAGTLTVPSR